jgi:methenyltetrahydrofolate cyclohydrolase
MTAYSTFVVVDLLDALASNEPVPGGGSAAALAGAAGVSLLMMVAGLPATKTGAPEEAADLAEAAARLRPLRDRLTELVDRDAAAYESVLAGLRLSRDGGRDTSARRTAIQAALRAATETPLDTMRACQQALRGAVIVVENGRSSARSDAGVGVELLLAAVRGAALNIDSNLTALTDDAFVARTTEERRQLAADSEADAERIRHLAPGADRRA